MTGRWLMNGVLFLACALLVLLARVRPESAPGLAELAGLSPEAVERIAIHRKNEPSLELIATAAGWRMRAPQQGPVSDTMAERLTALSRAPATRAFKLGGSDANARGPGHPEESTHEIQGHEGQEPTPPLADLGLAEPWLELELNDRRLRAGAAEPIDRRRYLQAGDWILLIDDRWLLPLLAPPEEYLLGASTSTSTSTSTGASTGTPPDTAATQGGALGAD